MISLTRLAVHAARAEPREAGGSTRPERRTDPRATGGYPRPSGGRIRSSRAVDGPCPRRRMSSAHRAVSGRGFGFVHGMVGPVGEEWLDGAQRRGTALLCARGRQIVGSGWLVHKGSRVRI
jgi:hypothetical protein